MIGRISGLLRACAMVAAMVGLMPHPAAHAASVLPLYLDEMADGAAVVFEGRCVGNRSEVDATTGFVVTYTTFEVRDVLKGSVGAVHEIKQVGGALPGDGLQYRVMGVPRFEVGQDYVLFLAGVSGIGFSSPIGLSQGRFTIAAKGAERKVANGRDFRDMARRMMAQVPPAARSQLEKSQGPVHEMGLAEFKQLVRDHLGAKR